MIGSTGKYPETNENYSHVTALSVSPMFRKCGLGTTLMDIILFNAKMHRSNFIDLFVRISNESAISFYKKHEYKVHDQIIKYYNDPVEDAYDMRRYI